MTLFQKDFFEDDPPVDAPARQVVGFSPTRIFLSKGSNTSPVRRRLAEKICAAYPEAEIVQEYDTPHNRIRLGVSGGGPTDLLDEGKRTLVLAEHGSSVQQSKEEGNSCPNFRHFSPYGFCPYGCSYCYLAGTQGVRFSPTVKVFLNLDKILDQIDRVAKKLDEPTAFYLGKLQDGLALDPLTGYSRRIVPFFAQHKIARMTLLTKSADVGNLLDLEHRGHSFLSWTLQPNEIIRAFETNTPSLEDRIAAMQAVSNAGYPVRAVVMPIIPIADWQTVYVGFLTDLLSRVRLNRITLGSICSYNEAMRLTESSLGRDNPISLQLDRRRMPDGRVRFPRELREKVYRRLIAAIRVKDASLDIGLCLEDPTMFDALDMRHAIGCCNCVL